LDPLFERRHLWIFCHGHQLYFSVHDSGFLGTIELLDVFWMGEVIPDPEFARFRNLLLGVIRGLTAGWP
jgi:hypothetical protein